EGRTPLPREAGTEPLAHVVELGNLTLRAEAARDYGEILGRASEDGGRLDLGDLERRNGPLPLRVPAGGAVGVDQVDVSLVVDVARAHGRIDVARVPALDRCGARRRHPRQRGVPRGRVVAAGLPVVQHRDQTGPTRVARTNPPAMPRQRGA